MNATTHPLAAARAAALFVSTVSVTDRPTGVEVEAAIRHALRTHGGARGCTADVAAAYGDHPELAAPRMRWARSVVDDVYRGRAQRAVASRPPAARCEGPRTAPATAPVAQAA